ncbi:GD14856 [Drosophila simulans]|uniref:GD14856 n=1 Tax=Drosophila simulans TaxID=7240 RepID=B4QRH2_DROSI|nr:GD14856 [Drosophila simulans]
MSEGPEQDQSPGLETRTRIRIRIRIRRRPQTNGAHLQAFRIDFSGFAVGSQDDVRMCLMRPEIIVWQLNESHMSGFSISDFGRMPSGNFSKVLCL